MPMKKTIRQLLVGYGFKKCSGGFVMVGKDKLSTTIKVIISAELRDKNVSMLNRYIKKEEIVITAKNIFGICKIPFIGYMQQIQGFRRKAVNEFAPNQMHCKEMGKFMEPPISTLFS